MRRSLRCAIEAIWPAIEAHIPVPKDHHPLGCHRRRCSDRVVVERLIYRVVVGCSYEDASVPGCSATTLRARRDEWLAAGVFDRLWVEVLSAYDQIVGLVLNDLSIDGCIVKAPCGGEVAGKNPVDRGKLGTKRSIAVDGRGVPVGWVLAGANVVDHKLLGATLDVVDTTLAAIRVERSELTSLFLDRGYDYKGPRGLAIERGFDLRVAERHTGMQLRSRQRWVVERTNSWHNNFGQPRRCTDRREACTNLSVLLANVIIVTRRLIARAARYRC